MKVPVIEKFFPAFRHGMLLSWLVLAPGITLADPVADYERGLQAYRIGDVVGAMAPLRSAADAGHAAAQALYGTILDAAEMDEDAVRYLRMAADQNDPDGQYGLAKMYLTGEAEAPDEKSASRLIRAAAEQGHERAIITLGLAYIAGNARLEANDPNDPDAARFIVKSAELGDVGAMDALIDAYREGQFGLEPNAAQSERWAARVAEIRGQGQRTGSRR